MVNILQVTGEDMYSKKIALLMLMVAGVCLGSDTNQPEVQADTKQKLLAPHEWDALYFTPLSDQNKKMVLSILKSNRQLLDIVKRDIFNGADAFLKAYADIVQYQSQSMTLFLPTPQQVLGCTMLPCIESYRGALEVYQTNLPIIQALETVPSIYTVWQKLSEFIPTDPHANADLLKRGITKALRSKQLKADIKQVVQDQVRYLDALIVYINTNHVQLAYEQEELERQVEELMAAMKQEQDMA